jgi:hypothetical protein
VFVTRVVAMTGAFMNQAASCFALAKATKTINKSGSGAQPQVQYEYSNGVHHVP